MSAKSNDKKKIDIPRKTKIKRTWLCFNRN